MKAITAENPSRVYESGTVVVDGIGFSLDKGEIFDFLGPNGTGKTTTVKLFCGMSRSEYEERAKQLLHRLELTDAMDRRLSAYSTGMRQRLSLARALLHRPQVLFLDEPTSGLDPESAQNVNSLIREQAAEGTTVFLCTHQLRYAQEICTVYGLMNKGRLFASGDITQLRSMVRRNISVRVKAGRMPDDMAYREAGDHRSAYRAIHRHYPDRFGTPLGLGHRFSGD